MSPVKLARNAAIVADWDTGTFSVYQLAAKYDVHECTVRSALRAAERRTSTPVQSSTFRVIAELIRTADSCRVIGDRVKVSRQSVHQTYKAAKAAGIPVIDRSKETNDPQP